MNSKSLILSTVGLLLLLWVFKIVTISYFDMTSWIMFAVFLIGTLLITLGTIRRAGKLNTFEVIIGFIWWTVVVLIWDFVFLTPIVGYDIYSHLYFWLGYVVMMLAILILHKHAPLAKK